MKTLKLAKHKFYTLNFWLLLLISLNSVVFGQTSTSDDSKTQATNNLNLTIQFLENIMFSVENSIIFTEQEVEKMSEYISEGQKMKTLLGDNLSLLHPDKTTLKSDLTQQFHFILQSLALYRSDLRNANFKATESSDKEFHYLLNKIDALITRLKVLTPEDDKLIWVRNKIEELNGYLQAAFGYDAPIHFTLEGIYSKDVKSISWQDVKNMSVKRNEGKVSITSIDGRDLQFDYTENQYTHIANMHVHFLAFYEKIAETVGGNSLSRNAITKTELERATQILNELIPNKNYLVSENGIGELDFGMVIDFSVINDLKHAVISIDEKALTLELCCEYTITVNSDETTTDYLTSATHSILNNQLTLARELKTIMDKLFNSENE